MSLVGIGFIPGLRVICENTLACMKAPALFVRIRREGCPWASPSPALTVEPREKPHDRISALDGCERSVGIMLDPSNPAHKGQER